MMRLGTVCSGIGAPEQAAVDLGWACSWAFEIEEFPSSVLALRHPGVVNYGDLTKHADHRLESIDVLCGGTPCQSFSVAGLRKGLDDPRGNLALVFLGLVDRLRPQWVVWENVPGVLSSVSPSPPSPVPPPSPVDVGLDGQGVETEDEHDVEEVHAFNCMLAGFSELGYGWAYWVPDAQHFGVAQRRERVFVVARLGDWAGPAAVLSDRGGLRGDPAPSREAGQKVTGTLSSRATAGGGLGTDLDLDLDGGLVAGTVQATYDRRRGSDMNPEQIVTHTLTGEGADASEDGTGRGTPLVVVPIHDTATRHAGTNGSGRDVGKGHGLGVGDPGDPMYTVTSGDKHAVAIPILEPGKRTGRSTDDPRAGIGIGIDGDPMYTLQAGAQNAVAFQPGNLTRGAGADPSDKVFPTLKSDHGRGISDQSPCVAFIPKDYGGDASEDVSPTLRAGNHDESHANGGCGPAVAINIRGRDGGATAEISGERATALRASQGGGDKLHVLTNMVVRRLTPRECERLQGFPDDYTRVPVKTLTSAPRSKHFEKYSDMYDRNEDGSWTRYCADGPRYRAIGNSMAVPCVRWIFRRIEIVSEILRDRAAKNKGGSTSCG